MYTIGIYPRKSVYRDNSESVQVQIQLCQDYGNILFKDREIEYRIYDKDEGFSGKNMNRPGFQEMLEDIRAGRLNAVIVYKLDRISRNVQEFSAMYEIFQQYGVSFISVKESFDTSTPMGRTVMYILAAFAQLERENTSERVTDNMRSLGASGKWTGGHLPSGMTSRRLQAGGREHSYLVVDQDTIGLVKFLYKLILDGYTITKLERHCRDNGIRSQSGKFLNTSQIYNIITNPVYCQNSIEAYHYFKDSGCILPEPSQFDGAKGLIGYGKTKTINGKTAQEKQGMANWTIAIGIHEPVIPAHEWIAAQTRLGINKKIRTAKYESGILKGVIRCSCGARMDVRTYVKNGILFSYYYCSDMHRQGPEKCSSGYVRVEKVEQAFLNQLGKIRFNPGGFRLRDTADENLLSSEALKIEIRNVQAAIYNLTANLMQALDSTASGYIIAKIEELDRQKKTLEAGLRRAELREESKRSSEEVEKQILENISYLLDNFDSISYKGKNELIRKTIKKCVFDGSSLRIVF